jgi:hypothetical protein
LFLMHGTLETCPASLRCLYFSRLITKAGTGRPRECEPVLRAARRLA